MALLYKKIGKYKVAEQLYCQAIEIQREALGANHPEFALNLNNLGVLYYAMGNYVAAERLYQQAMDIQRATVGEEHLDFARTLNNLAALSYMMGKYTAAERLYRQVIEIKRITLGEFHPSFAISLNNLAELFRITGNYVAAEPLLRQALEIRRAALGETHPELARSLNNLAMMYEAVGNYTAAEHLYRQAVWIQRASLGEDHPDLANSLGNLAELLRVQGEYTAAEPLLRQVMEVDRRTLGENHPTFATNLNNLAALYHSIGNYAAAEPLYQQALDIRRAALGEEHPYFAQSLNNLASLCIATGHEDKAMNLMQQTSVIYNRMIGQIFSIGSDNQRMSFLKSIQWNFNLFLSLVFNYFPDSTMAVSSALELVLRRKAIAAEALATQRDAVLGGKYPDLKPKLHELTTLRMQIAQKTLAGTGPEGLSTHQQLLAEWNTQKEKLETELARQVPELNLEQKLHAASRQAIALALPEGATLIEFVRFNVFDFKAVPAHGESQWKPARYLAFVLPAGEPNNVQMIDLGEAEPIDRMITTFRAAITGEDESRGRRDLGALLSQPVDGPNISNGASLRAALFDPLLPAIGNRKRLLLAPDGDVTRLPFEVLPTDDGRRLIDDYQISYLGTGRDVLRFGAASSGQPAEPLVAADPDFDLNGGQAQAQSVSETVSAASRGRASPDMDCSHLHFARLPGTQVEGKQIAQMLNVQPWLADMALEARLKACRSPRILHLATHGFFLADQRRDPNKEFRGLGATGWQTGDSFGRMSGPGMENPLLRSGLALAGANTWLKHGNPPAEAEDGILTAEDVTGLDLLATELVVLSACETGLGEVRTGEGVFGLRRAFVLAGAKTLVMSLWKVPDAQTRELMEDFYRRILSGQPRAEALREAQLAMKAKCPDPFYWGAFICQGDPNPLPATVQNTRPAPRFEN